MQGKVKITKLTDTDLLNQAFQRTGRGTMNVSLLDAYRWEHSPMRTQLFWVEMDGIALFASTHILRHTTGAEPFIRTQRPDRGGDVDEGRWSPHDHAILLNAQTLINMAKARLCYKAHVETRAIMQALKEAVMIVDRDLACYMVPQCVYRNGLCQEEPRGCGRLDVLMHRYAYYVELFQPGGVAVSKAERVALIDAKLVTGMTETVDRWGAKTTC